MSDDIVTRLREHKEDEAMLGNDWLVSVLAEAADEIERLRAEVSRLGSFLHPIGTVIDGQVVHGE